EQPPRASFPIPHVRGGAHQVAPSRTAEDVFAKGQRVLEVILLHDPGSSQTAAGKPVLGEILLQHYFFEDFGQGIAARVGAVPLLLGNRQRMRVEKMPERRIASD